MLHPLFRRGGNSGLKSVLSRGHLGESVRPDPDSLASTTSLPPTQGEDRLRGGTSCEQLSQFYQKQMEAVFGALSRKASSFTTRGQQNPITWGQARHGVPAFPAPSTLGISPHLFPRPLRPHESGPCNPPFLPVYPPIWLTLL